MVREMIGNTRNKVSSAPKFKPRKCHVNQTKAPLLVPQVLRSNEISNHDQRQLVDPYHLRDPEHEEGGI